MIRLDELFDKPYSLVRNRAIEKEIPKLLRAYDAKELGVQFYLFFDRGAWEIHFARLKEGKILTGLLNEFSRNELARIIATAAKIINDINKSSTNPVRVYTYNSILENIFKKAIKKLNPKADVIDIPGGWVGFDGVHYKYAFYAIKHMPHINLESLKSWSNH